MHLPFISKRQETKFCWFYTRNLMPLSLFGSWMIILKFIKVLDHRNVCYYRKIVIEWIPRQFCLLFYHYCLCGLCFLSLFCVSKRDIMNDVTLCWVKNKLQLQVFGVDESLWVGLYVNNPVYHEDLSFILWECVYQDPVKWFDLLTDYVTGPEVLVS